MANGKERKGEREEREERGRVFFLHRMNVGISSSFWRKSFFLLVVYLCAIGPVSLCSAGVLSLIYVALLIAERGAVYNSGQ